MLANSGNNSHPVGRGNRRRGRPHQWRTPLELGFRAPDRVTVPAVAQRASGSLADDDYHKSSAPGSRYRLPRRYTKHPRGDLPTADRRPQTLRPRPDELSVCLSALIIDARGRAHDHA